MKNILSFNEYTLNESISRKEIESAKGNKDKIKSLFTKVFANLMNLPAIKNHFDELLENNLDNLYKCLLDGAMDGFKSKIVFKNNKFIYVLGSGGELDSVQL